MQSFLCVTRQESANLVTCYQCLSWNEVIDWSENVGICKAQGSAQDDFYIIGRMTGLVRSK